ncbi:MAG: fumarylacetoacetase [Bryobacteraceae bacterium]|nr:fumarylacetoacetase [Bryobacteraceae bacterium]MDW8377022.1 fumarylacetoacetase [Bryobacterales bacterium]
MIDETHDPALRSWVELANVPGCDFPIQNLPLGVYSTAVDPNPRPGVAIGDAILDLRPWLSGPHLADYFSLSASDRRLFRLTLSRALRQGAPTRPLIPLRDAILHLPAPVGDYTDFYCSLHHASNVGKMFRPNQPLSPNYSWMPLAYHGRSSSIVVSPTPVRRPCGQLGENRFGPTAELDYELELGAWLGPGSMMGRPVSIDQAEDHWAGICLLNDWSARDIQRWEYQPLGPFLSKNFATSISPWVITREALEPFRVSYDAPQPLPYLKQRSDGAFDLTLEAWIRTPTCSTPELICRTNLRYLHWTLAQMIAHHTSNGCPIRPGDLIGTGTVSGPDPESQACLLERTWRGTQPLRLASGEERGYLEDGDEVILRGWAERPGFVRIGLGECRGVILAALEENSQA